MNAAFDGIILGTGHNALILQAYLSRYGLRTLSVDRAPIPGGGLMTIDNPRLPGFRHNPHSFFHRGVTAMPWYRDLELERQGVRYLEPKLNVAMILRDGRALEWWTDLDRTVATCAGFSMRDADTLRRLAEESKPIVEKILLPEAQSPPLEPGLRRGLFWQIRRGPSHVTGGEIEQRPGLHRCRIAHRHAGAITAAVQVTQNAAHES